LNIPVSRRYVVERPIGQEIPKVIYQVYSEHNLPEPLKRNVDSLKNKNPNWTHRLFNDESMLSYVKSEFPEIYPYYKRINPAYVACRVDLFRYLLIYNEGGVYFDIKSGANKPLNEIIRIRDLYILSHWSKSEKKIGHHKGISNPNGELQQFHILAAKGHPFLRAVIDNVCNNIELYNPIIHGCGGLSVMMLSGPIAYTNVITPIMDKYPHRLSLDHEELGVYFTCLENANSHHVVYKKMHYSQLNSPIITQNFVVNCIFYSTNRIKKFIFSLLTKFTQ
jgi:mannosyltransferase OCH1-like enzyme